MELRAYVPVINPTRILYGRPPQRLRSHPLEAWLALLQVPQQLPGGRVIQPHSSPGSTEMSSPITSLRPRISPKEDLAMDMGRVLPHPPATRPRPGVKHRPA